MEKLISILLISLLLVGCGKPKPKVIFQPIEVPVPVECEVEIPTRPDLTLSNIEDLNPNDPIHHSIIVKSYAITIVQLIAYSNQLEKLLIACTKLEKD